MKATDPFEKDQQLSELLREWKPQATLPPRFQEQVWKHIRRAEAEKPQSSLAALWHTIDAAFRRPALAWAYVTVLMFVGLGVGYLQAQDKTAQSESKWRALYVQSVDPYQAPRN